MSETWSFGRIAAGIGAAVDPDLPALIHGDLVRGWGEFDRRTDALAAAFAAATRPGDKVAHLMRNGPAYLETTWAAFKSRLVHVNVNYRYTGSELYYILDNSDAAIIVYDAEFGPLVNALRPRLTKVRMFVESGDEFEALAGAPAAPLQMAHDEGDLLFIYTGGTTGHPKGVMWEQGAIWALLGGGATAYGGAPAASFETHLENVRTGEGRRRLIVLPPLMHGSGFLVAVNTLACGGTVITLTNPGFQPLEALDLCARHHPTNAVIVGDAFARPLLRALDGGGGDIGSLELIISSGTMWSPDVKAGLIRHNPRLMLVDALSSSESLGMGASIVTAANAGEPTHFMRDDATIVVGEDLRPVEPGSGVVGRIGRAGLLPLGYYKDEEKTAATFLELDGIRYALAGDHAVVEADGTITLMGRGNQCINTGGEKVYPEEVEETLKSHAAVEDALVFGLPDEKWGQAVSAVVETRAPVSADEVIAHARAHLAAYKAPKRVIFVAKVPRAPNGKADYAAARALATELAAG